MKGERFIKIIIALFIFVSCGKRENPNEGLSIFKYNDAAGILTLDPIYAKDLPHIWACNQLYSSLVAFDDEMNVVPTRLSFHIISSPRPSCTPMQQMGSSVIALLMSQACG